MKDSSVVDQALTRPAHLRPWLWPLVLAIALAFSLFQLYGAGVEPLGLFYQRSIHLGFVLVLVFLLFPLTGQRPRGWLGWGVDTLWLAAALLTGSYIGWNLDAIANRAGFWTQTDIWVGIIAVVTLLEASRRAIGLGLTLIGVLAIVYALAGPRGDLPWLSDWLPEVMQHRGNDIERLVGQLYLGQEGIFGLPLGVAATYVFMFVLFGAMLEVTGAGRFFIDLAYAATGRKRGGPAKAAVLASAGMGSISGSAIANVVTTGAFTIPLMKRLGYKPAQAGGVEAAASTGGQITPPLMGAGAFLISEYTRLPYLHIVMVSIFPAFLYLGSIYLFVHAVAHKQKIPLPDASGLPDVRQVLRAGWHFLLPLLVLLVLLLANLSPMRVGFWAIVCVLLVAALRGLWHAVADRSGTLSQRLLSAARRGVRQLLAALTLGARNALAVSLACAVAGILVGVVGLTGLGLKFSSVMLSFAGDNLLLALLLVLLASLVLGMGLPVTAAYIVLIVLVGPALSNGLGVPLLIAHLVVFWYSQDSNVTPPIALAGFAGAAIAGASPMRTSVQAWKFAKALYLVPLLMVYKPEMIVGGEWSMVLLAGVTALLVVVAMVAVLEGYLWAPVPLWQRLLLALAVLAAFVETPLWGWLACGTLAALLGTNFRQRQPDTGNEVIA